MIRLSNYKDVDDESISYVNEFYRLIESGKKTEADAYLKKYSALLSSRLINAESFNKIEREIHSAQEELYYKQRIVKSKTIPDSDAYQLANGSLWLKEYWYGNFIRLSYV